jgi:ubiquinone/menaquinone biosynthesis C-methylase UbiE
MDLLKLSAVAHSSHHFSSPVSVETLDRVLALSGIAHGWRVIDLGCGPATMSAHLAERYGVQVEAVDRSAVMLDLARSRLAGQSRVRFHQAESMDYLGKAEPCDLLVVVGAGALVPGAVDNAAQLQALAQAAKPGGRILWGESFWKREPSAMLRAATGPVARLDAGHGY